eukprot:TRINITY_DN6421_c0_g1_i3.p1 TRINITY_DN6421_c0_g1~~TRINITY_DN6421_c0_g1_i3.p1  ORF type:complete len:447 (-),score=44.70 TRINITY_DN6421_c0_g1_i3:203-1543(-)
MVLRSAISPHACQWWSARCGGMREERLNSGCCLRSFMLLDANTCSSSSKAQLSPGHSSYLTLTSFPGGSHAVGHSEQVQDLLGTNRKVRQLRLCIKHTAHSSVVGLEEVTSLLAGPETQATVSLPTHSPAAAVVRAELNFLRRLEAAVSICPFQTIHQQSLRIALFELTTQLEGATESLRLGLEECRYLGSPVTDQAARCTTKDWKRFSEVVSQAHHQVQLLGPTQLPDEAGLRSLMSSVQSMNREWERIWNRATARESTSQLSDTGNQIGVQGQELWSPMCDPPPDSAELHHPSQDQSVEICSNGPVSETREEQSGAGCLLTSAEFEGRRVRIAQEMEHRLKKAAAAQPVPSPRHQVHNRQAVDEVAMPEDKEQAALVAPGPLPTLCTIERPRPMCRSSRSGKAAQTQRDACAAQAEHLESSRKRMATTAPNFLSELSNALSHHS